MKKIGITTVIKVKNYSYIAFKNFKLKKNSNCLIISFRFVSSPG